MKLYCIVKDYNNKVVYTGSDGKKAMSKIKAPSDGSKEVYNLFDLEVDNDGHARIGRMVYGISEKSEMPVRLGKSKVELDFKDLEKLVKGCKE